VLVLGGTGRVGGSTTATLSKLRPDLSIIDIIESAVRER
jgi:Trk K+ transport system NAD-binding subunit